MPIETLDDIVEEIADMVGVYGGHSDAETKTCRICFTEDIRRRILSAAEVEAILVRR